MFYQFKHIENNFLSKIISFIFYSLVLILFVPQKGNTFNKPLNLKTQGENSPHILRSNNFSLNARNIKVLKSQKNILWIGTSMGVIKYDKSSSENQVIYDNRNGLLSNGIFSITTGPQKKVWIGTYGGGLSRLDKNGWVNINTPHGLNDAFVYDQKFVNDSMWIATWSGANRVSGNPFYPESWESFTVENTNGGLIDNWVYSIQIGQNNNVWFGTEAGLSLFNGKKWFNWNHKNGLGAPYRLVESDNRKVTDTLKGSHHEQQSPTLPNTKTTTYRPNYIVSMLLDKINRLWIGTWGGGLSLFDLKTQTFRNFTVQDGLPGNYILTINEGPDGNLWIGSNKGLSQFDGTHFLNYSKVNGLNTNYVFSIEFDKKSFLWIGGHHGIAQLKIDPSSGNLLRIGGISSAP